MAEFAVPKRQEDPDPAAEAYLSRVEAELSRRGVQREEDWQKIFQQAKVDCESGRFLIEQLGAERYLEPRLMATLAQLRQGLLGGIQNPTAADSMMADTAVIAYRNLLRVQGWIGDLCLVVERELFGQEPLNRYHGPTVGAKLEEKLRRLEEHMLLLERCHRMMVRSLTHLESSRSKAAKTAVTIGQAGQVNVDCAVVNKASRPQRSLGACKEQ
jgi:hypothetical protein